MKYLYATILSILKIKTLKIFSNILKNHNIMLSKNHDSETVYSAMLIL